MTITPEQREEMLARMRRNSAAGKAAAQARLAAMSVEQRAEVEAMHGRVRSLRTRWYMGPPNKKGRQQGWLAPEGTP
jgi:hypothetical protein